jgi:hypothetical protein
MDTQLICYVCLFDEAGLIANEVSSLEEQKDLFLGFAKIAGGFIAGPLNGMLGTAPW